MNFRRLQYFLGVVEHGGFAKASSRLFVAQSALSTQIKKLEDELGAALFLRNAAGIKLTPAGDLLLRHAQVIAAQAASCKREIHDLVSDELRGIVRLGIAAGAGRMLTIPLLHRLQREWPNVSLHVIEALTADLERDLENGLIDVGIGFNWSGATRTEKVARASDVLRAEELYLVEALEDGARVGPALDVSDLHRIDLIIPTRRYATRQFLDEELATRGNVLRIQHELDSLEQTMQMVIAGEGKSVMLVSTFLSSWRTGKVGARAIRGLGRQPQLFIKESRHVANRAPSMVKEMVRSIANELTANGSWPSLLGAE